MVAIQRGFVAAVLFLSVAGATAREPAGTILADDGKRLEFDDAFGGQHAIRLRDAQGRLVRDLDLGVFLPAAYVSALPRGEARLHWLRQFKSVAGEDRVEFTVPTPGSAAGVTGPALHFSIDLRDGSVRTAQIREYLAALDEARALEASTTLARR